MMINKRYKDIFSQYIHKGEPTPLTIGTLVVCAMCFLMLIVATFTQIHFSHPWFQHIKGEGFTGAVKTIAYTPQIPVMMFIIYLLGKKYSYLMLTAYLLTGFFIWPVFAFGGGLDYIHNYLFGYLLGFFFATGTAGAILAISQDIKSRFFASLIGVATIHAVGFFYCFILAILKVIDFSLIGPIVNAMSGSKIIYDTLFSILTLLIAPYIKNFFWICMKPKADSKKPKKSKKSRHKKQDNRLSH